MAAAASEEEAWVADSIEAVIHGMVAQTDIGEDTIVAGSAGTQVSWGPWAGSSADTQGADSCDCERTACHASFDEVVWASAQTHRVCLGSWYRGGSWAGDCLL